jgi:hypothetical protein
MPTVLTLLGMRFFYWAREHEPIHVHVKKDDAEARFDIEPQIELTANMGFKPHELAIAEEVIRDNREYIIEHWKLFFKKDKS